ncbi:DNA repair protein RecN [Kineosporia sp. J2-2]|uniref:DNA repair protein RecN n=1 Tax=Kineosporia corallincola TaxID=2835133 RepID=A0ABS5TN70_9ACTN|nr:DNA repair protein RecN [Kineosporia corallincola]MBT0772552.1 DNA repair protein RecN [Kineosporia corallincola]
MLQEMHLRGLGVIDDAVLEFGPGLTVVTGETGAGKTMVVTGLGLLMGGRADAGSVREGYQSALVEGRLVLDPRNAAVAKAVEAGAELDDGDTLVIARTVSAEGRSRAHVGGRGVPNGLLGEMSGDLVAVHGQSDQIRLQSTVKQRESLDRFGGAAVARALAAYRKTYAELRTVEKKHREITQQFAERVAEAERLRAGLTEIEKVAPQPGEDHELKAESQRLAHAEGLQQAAATANQALSGESEGFAVASLMNQVRRALEGGAPNDPALGDLARRAAEIGYLVDDLATECASYAAGVEADPVRLAAVEDRRATLSHLVRGYGDDVDATLAWAQQASVRLLELDNDEQSVDELAGRVNELRTALARQAAALTKARRTAAAKLAKAVTGELQELSMVGSRLFVEVNHKPDDDGLLLEPETTIDLTATEERPAAPAPGPVAFGPDGADEIEMLLAPHPGASPRPLGKGASGGELSRVMLGLEVVLGAVDPVPTFVFDEVDSGVGGKAALGIGRRLARLARNSQVLVVTHLPQVAAFADQHLLVRKAHSGEVTSSGVHTLDTESRIRELARMLGGLEDSGSAQAHAEELLQMAEADRQLV